MRRSRSALGAAWLALAQPGAAGAGDWHFEPHLRVATTFTDNVGLAPAGSESGDTIFEVTPRIHAWGRGSRSEARLEYSPRTLTHLRHRDLDRVDHLLSAEGKAEPLANFLFVEARADRSLQTLSLARPQAVDPALDAGNRAVAESYFVSPYVRRALGPVTHELRYLRDHVGTDQALLPSSDGDSVAYTARSGPAFNRFGFGAHYLAERVRYEGARHTRRESASAELWVEVAASLAALASAGHEDNDYPHVGAAPAGALWSAGLKWEPGRLTRLVATAGERFFGRTARVEFSHQSRRLRWTLRYARDISWPRTQLLAASGSTTFAYLDAQASLENPDPFDRARAVNEFIAAHALPTRVFSAAASLAAEPFLEKRLDASLTVRASKTTLIFTVFRVERDTRAVGSDPAGFLAAADPALSPNGLQKGIGAIASWKLAPRTEVALDLGYNDARLQASGVSTSTRFATLGLRHRVSRKIAATLDLRRTSGGERGGESYRENALVAAVSAQF